MRRFALPRDVVHAEVALVATSDPFPSIFVAGRRFESFKCPNIDQDPTGADKRATLFKRNWFFLSRFLNDQGDRHPVDSLDDYKLAPFHLLASEGAVHADKPHTWHMETLGSLCQADEKLFRRTRYEVLNLGEETDVAKGIAWWESLTAKGGEGMVVKPLEFTVRSPKGLVQPAVKCRGKEYLRIIYGPDYDAEENLTRLRKRGLASKRGLALQEFALGIEALERFVNREPLLRVHECVFGVLALESEPVDPRL